MNSRLRSRFCSVLVLLPALLAACGENNGDVSSTHEDAVDDTAQPDGNDGDTGDVSPVDVASDVPATDASDAPDGPDTADVGDTVDVPDVDAADVDDGDSSVEPGDVPSFDFPDAWDPRPGCAPTEGSGNAEAFPPTMEEVWEGSGEWRTFSSIRLRDLDGDCVLDIVAGRGDEILQLGWVTAISGATGDVLWDTEVRDEPVGSASFVDVNDDGIDDVVIGGRNSLLVAVDGASGDLLWEFFAGRNPRDAGWFNFYTNQIVGDFDADGIRDILAANGGDATLAPFEEPRPPGKLMIISAATAEVIHSARVPDRAETYMSALIYVPHGGAEPMVVFGTGGETLPGSLWRVPLSAIATGDIDEAAEELLGPASYKGLIAPPSIADLDGDGVLDMVVATFDGRLVAISGASSLPLWSVPVPGSETYASPAIGYFDEDDVPDVIAAFSLGAWPAYRGTRYLIVSGSNGSVLWEYASARGFGVSPLAVDLDEDGFDEVVIGEVDFGTGTVWSVIDTPGYERTVIAEPGWGGVGSPAIADVDGDGWLELLAAGSGEPGGSDVPIWSVARFALDARASGEPAWGGYLGSRGDGVFRAVRPRE